MLELRLRSGPVVAFDGRVLEVFHPATGSKRFHVAQLNAPEAVEAVERARTLSLGDGATTLAFAAEEAPAFARLVSAIAAAQADVGNAGA